MRLSSYDQNLPYGELGSFCVQAIRQRIIVVLARRFATPLVPMARPAICLVPNIMSSVVTTILSPMAPATAVSVCTPVSPKTNRLLVTFLLI